MDDILLITAGLAVLTLLILLFTGKLKWHTVVLIIAGIAAVAGVYAFRDKRRSAVLEEARKKEAELKKKEADLKQQQERAQITKAELDKQLEELDKTRQDYAKKMLSIDAEEKENIQEAKARVSDMSAEELKQEFLKRIGQ